MNKFRLTINVLAIAAFMLAIASMAQAQATRTWVSGVGDDANPCSRTAPCKTFAGAISKTATGGEIDALDPGGFGAVTITKAITLEGTGTMAGILNSLTQGIIINANQGTTDNVTIRGISIDGAANGTNGISVLAADRVSIEDCVIFGQNNGVSVNVSADVNLNMRNTVVRNNVTDGLVATASAGLVKATIVNCSFIGNNNGIHPKANTRIDIFNSNMSNNVAGVFAEGLNGIAVANISNSSISHNSSVGLQAGGGSSNQASIIRVNSSDIMQNITTGVLVAAQGEIDTWQNNRIEGNGANGCTSCTPRTFN
jgi:hypothetical protein